MKVSGIGRRIAQTVALASVLASVGAEAHPPSARRSARAIPAFRLACSRYGHDHASIRNAGTSTVPGGTRIVITAAGGATGGPATATGELHTALKPGAVWSSIARLPGGFKTCEAVVDGARPL